LKAAERIHIDGLCSRKIKLKCVSKGNISKGISNQRIETIDTSHSLITGPPATIKFDKEGNAYTVIKTVHPMQFGLKETILENLQNTIQKKQSQNNRIKKL
jgi:hypothetical protein